MQLVAKTTIRNTRRGRKCPGFLPSSSYLSTSASYWLLIAGNQLTWEPGKQPRGVSTPVMESRAG